MKNIDITEREAGQRLDKFLGKYMCQAPKSFFYKMLRKKNIVLNGKKADGSERLAAGDRLTLYLAEETIRKFTAENDAVRAESSMARMLSEEDVGKRPQRGRTSPKTGGKPPFSVLYEDRDILVLNKPWGMLTQKAKAGDVSLNEYLIAWLLDTGRMTEEQLWLQKPSVCNRLDRNTSGIVLAGISLRGLQGLSRILKERSGRKLYYALVWGRVEEPCRLKGYLVKDAGTNQVKIFSEKEGVENAKYIETAYRPLGYGGGCTLLEIHLITGRSHQIRAHLSAEGHFVIGDSKYGKPEINRKFAAAYGLRGQLLHAGVFVMPEENCPFVRFTGKRFTAPLERRFASVLEGLGISWPEKSSAVERWEIDRKYVD